MRKQHPRRLCASNTPSGYAQWVRFLCSGPFGSRHPNDPAGHNTRVSKSLMGVRTIQMHDDAQPTNPKRNNGDPKKTSPLGPTNRAKACPKQFQWAIKEHPQASLRSEFWSSGYAQPTPPIFLLAVALLIPGTRTIAGRNTRVSNLSRMILMAWSNNPDASAQPTQPGDWERYMMVCRASNPAW